jgi:hypothetical protein
LRRPIEVNDNINNNKSIYYYYYHHHHYLLYSSLAGAKIKGAGLTDQALLVHSSAKNVLTVRHVLSITAL